MGKGGESACRELWEGGAGTARKGEEGQNFFHAKSGKKGSPPCAVGDPQKVLRMKEREKEKKISIRQEREKKQLSSKRDLQCPSYTRQIKKASKARRHAEKRREKSSRGERGLQKCHPPF